MQGTLPPVPLPLLPAILPPAGDAEVTGSVLSAAPSARAQKRWSTHRLPQVMAPSIAQHKHFLDVNPTTIDLLGRCTIVGAKPTGIPKSSMDSGRRPQICWLGATSRAQAQHTRTTGCAALQADAAHRQTQTSLCMVFTPWHLVAVAQALPETVDAPPASCLCLPRDPPAHPLRRSSCGPIQYRATWSVLSCRCRRSRLSAEVRCSGRLQSGRCWPSCSTL
jgi:hypothetical protein